MARKKKTSEEFNLGKAIATIYICWILFEAMYYMHS